MGKGGFKELRVWQKSKDLAVYIYQITNTGRFTKDYGLKDQIRRASISIPSNIAEGDERETDKEAVRYFYVVHPVKYSISWGRGSSAEVLTQATIALEIGYLTEETFKEIEKRCIEISSMLSRLISARSRTFCP